MFSTTRRFLLHLFPPPGPCGAGDPGPECLGQGRQMCRVSGKALFCSGDVQSARKEYEAALELNGDSMAAWEGVAELEVAENDLLKAADVYRRLVRLAHLHLADTSSHRTGHAGVRPVLVTSSLSLFTGLQPPLRDVNVCCSPAWEAAA